MDWSFFYNFNYFGSEIRRLYLLTPLISIIIAVGFFYLFNRFSKQYAKKDFGFFFAWLFCFLVLICVSLFQLKFVKLAGTYLSYILIPMADELFTLPTFLASLLIPLLVVFLVYLVNKVAGFGKLSINGKLVTFSHRRRVLVSVAALVVIVSVSLVPLNVVQLFGDANSSHWDSGEYAKKALVPAWENYMSEVIDYYNSSLPDNYVTVSFGWETDALVYFANRSVINIGEGVGGYSFLVSNDTEGLLNSLYQSNIRYFLIPNENAVYSATATYSQYMVVSSRILLFRLIPDRDYFFSVKNFTCFSLYKLAVPSGN
jgi:hypothetical protein